MRQLGFGDLVKQGRARKGWTQVELAERLSQDSPYGFTQATISGWESGRQAPDRGRLREIAAALSRLFELDSETLFKAGFADAPSVRASDDFLFGASLTRDIVQAAEHADSIWAINPSALAFVTEKDVRDIWVEGVADQRRQYVVLWPLDVITSGGFLRARAAFQLLADEVRTRTPGGGFTRKIQHYAFSRGEGFGGVDLSREYVSITGSLDPALFEIKPPVSLLTVKEGGNRGVRAAIAGYGPPILASQDFDLVVDLDQACDRMLAFAQWNAASVLYDTGVSPKLSIYHREVKSLDGLTSRNDGGLWRGEAEAFEMKRAVESFKRAADHLFERNATTAGSGEMRDVKAA